MSYKRNGYVYVKRSDLKTTGRGWMLEHRAAWIDNHGPIPPGAVIHHINGKRDDNRIENLQLYQNNGIHRHECHVDLSWLEPDHPRLKPFDLVDMMFIRSHLPIDWKSSHI
jgi:hypothetical protein